MMAYPHLRPALLLIGIIAWAQSCTVNFQPIVPSEDKDYGQEFASTTAKTASQCAYKCYLAGGCKAACFEPPIDGSEEGTCKYYDGPESCTSVASVSSYTATQIVRLECIRCKYGSGTSGVNAASSSTQPAPATTPCAVTAAPTTAPVEPESEGPNQVEPEPEAAASTAQPEPEPSATTAQPEPEAAATTAESESEPGTTTA